MKKFYSIILSVFLVSLAFACDSKVENRMEDKAEQMEEVHENKADVLEERADMHRDTAEAYDEAH